jgi:signal transduction histidine kinase
MMATMPASAQRAERGSRVLWGVTVLIALIGLALTIVAWGDLILADSLANVAGAFAGVVYATLGALIVRRARNLIGWLLQGVGLGFVILSATDAYAVLGIAYPGSFPAADIVGAIAGWVFVVTAPSLAFMLLFFPTGRLPSPRWRPILLIGIVAVALTSIGFLFNPVPLALPAPGGALRVPNPLGIESFGVPISTALVATVWTVVLTIAAAFGALVARYRAGGREPRQQIKWVAFVAALSLLANLVAIGALVVCSCDSSPVATVTYAATVILVFFGMPAALSIAILKYRLYEIDVIISRAIVYGSLATVVTAIYVVVVVGFGSLVGYGTGSPVLTTATAVAIALLFQPLRRQAQRVANSLVYGERATPYQVLSDFAERMGGTYGVDDVLRRMAAILGQATGATHVEVWLRVGRELRPGAAWPAEIVMPGPMPLRGDDELPALDGVTRAVAVRHDGELLGALALEKPQNEPLTPTEDKLLQDLASQAGLVLRNVGLAAELQSTIDELQASRRRLVQAQDEERRRIERNLHDGAQQQLIALTIELGLLERLADDPERVRQAARRLQEALREALDDLRDLARGIYPPLLADKGLAAALEAQARKAALPITIDAGGIARYAREVEAAVYFCALEALQNVAKYARATRAAIRLQDGKGRLAFTVTDDGVGFDVHAAAGSGLTNMRDRLDALGGSLQVRSSPGAGTTISGSIPLAL